MAEDTNKKILTTEPAAAYLGLKRSTLEAWRCRGGGPVFLKLGKAVRYRQSDLDKFLEGQARTSTSQVGR
jgi:excisionase family DNA binding protein